MKIVSLREITAKDSSDVTIVAVISNESNVTTLYLDSSRSDFSELRAEVQKLSLGETTNSELAEFLVGRADTISNVEAGLRKIEGILNGRMTIEAGRVYIDHDPVDTALERHILRLLDDDGKPHDVDAWTAFAAFCDKIYRNVSADVRGQLLGWLDYENENDKGFTLTKDGNLIGYKGCAGTSDAPTSISTGTAYVDGVKHVGRIPNVIGSEVTMPRSKVTADPAQGCGPGLHVGTYAYASGWASGVLLTVSVDPTDIVSVPTECNAQKMRVCRYTVIDAVRAPLAATYYANTADDDYDAQDDNVCDECDETEDYCACDDNEEVVTHDDDTDGDNSDGTVSFRYNRVTGGTDSYTITVDDVTSTHVNGRQLDGSYRTFIRTRILDGRYSMAGATSRTGG